MNIFGKMIKEARAIQGYTLARLGGQMKIDAAIVSKVERGLRQATRSQVTQFIQVLELPEKEAFAAWLSDKILSQIQHEHFGLEALVVAEEQMKYLHQQKDEAGGTLSKDLKELVSRLDELSNEWGRLKPLAGIQLVKMQEYFNVAYTYNSNRIEGNTLTLQETHLVVNEGLTIGGKSMREHLEAVNHYEAITYLYELVQRKVPITEKVIKELHQLVLKGIDRANAGVYRRVPVIISGSEHKPPQPFMLAPKMEALLTFYEANRLRLHPVLLASEMHLQLVTIHPFIDGNGRTSRLLMNLILLQHGFTIANLKGSQEARLVYYKSLEEAHEDSQHVAFHRLILETSIRSLEEHIAMC